MKLSRSEKRIMIERLKQLKSYVVQCLKQGRMDEYFNTLNSREFRMLEEILIEKKDYSFLSLQVSQLVQF